MIVIDCFTGIFFIFFILSIFINLLYVLGNLFCSVIDENSKYNFDILTLVYGLLVYLGTILFFVIIISILSFIGSIIYNTYSFLKNKIEYLLFKRDLNKYSSEKN